MQTVLKVGANCKKNGYQGWNQYLKCKSDTKKLKILEACFTVA